MSTHQRRSLDVNAERRVQAADVQVDGSAGRGRGEVLMPPTPVTTSAGRSRVQQRLDEISHEAQASGQFGPAVRAEELLGRSVGMFIDRSIQLSGTMNDSHISALLEIARKRQAEPVDLADEETET